MSPRLDELAHNWSLLEAEIDLAEGELTDDLAARHDLLTYEERQKVDRCVLYLKGLEGEIEKWKELEDEMQAKRRAAERRIEWLKGLMKRYMTERQHGELQGDIWKVKLCKSGRPPVELLVDPKMLPEEFVVYEVRANKEALRRWLETNPPVCSYARLGEPTQSLRIS